MVLFLYLHATVETPKRGWGGPDFHRTACSHRPCGLERGHRFTARNEFQTPHPRLLLPDTPLVKEVSHGCEGHLLSKPSLALSFNVEEPKTPHRSKNYTD